MFKLYRLLQSMYAITIFPRDTAGSVEPISAGEKDPVRATLIESHAKNRGVTIYSNGASISMVVTAIEDGYVMGRNQQVNRIVIRYDRIDGLTAAF